MENESRGGDFLKVVEILEGAEGGGRDFFQVRYIFINLPMRRVR